jgi:glycosyltransferase involved in cell wall biosynthesis
MYHLCILTPHFYPVKSSCSSLFKDLIKSLLDENYKITVMSLSGINNKVRQINTKKITYISIKNPYLQSNQNYLRALGDILAIAKLRKFYDKKNFTKFDQVLVYTPSIFWAIILFKLKKKLVNIKLGDLYPKWLADHKIIRKFSISFLILKFFELLIYSQANNIFVQTEKDLDYLKKYKKFFNFNTGVIYNWINTKQLKNDKVENKKREYKRFLFLGVVGLAQDYKLLSRMIEYCNNKKYKCTFYFIGSGTKKTDLEKLTSHFKSVFFFSEMQISKIDKIIKRCDVCISTLSKNFYSENFPGRILRYMANNKAMLVHSPNNNFLKNLIEGHSLGLYSSDEEKFYKNIDFIFTNFESFQKKGINGLEITRDKFSCENAKKILFNFK